MQALIVLNWFESTEIINEAILSSKTMGFNENISILSNLQSLFIYSRAYDSSLQFLSDFVRKIMAMSSVLF